MSKFKDGGVHFRNSGLKALGVWTGGILFPFLHLYSLRSQLITNICAWNSLNLISRNSRTPWNTETHVTLQGQNVTGYMYITHLYCLIVQADYCSCSVEYRTLGWEKCYIHFYTCYTYIWCFCHSLTINRLSKSRTWIPVFFLSLYYTRW